jgi:sigma-B regulation protein RsbU (phosphoserine phosphatase)
MASNRNFPITELLKSLMPITPMGKAMCLGVIVWFIDWVFVIGDSLFGSQWLKTLVDIGSALAFIPLFYFLAQGANWIKEHLLWGLRRQLIVTYLLIGALPLFLLLLLVGFIGYAVATQYSVGLVSRKLDNYLEQSGAVALSLGRDLNRTEMMQLSVDELRRKLQERCNALSAIFPGIRLTIRRTGPAGGVVSVQGQDADPDSLSAPQIAPAPPPSWLESQPRFDGLSIEESPVRQLHVRHWMRFSDPVPMIFELSYPISRALCGHLGKAASLDVRPGLGFTKVVMTPNGPGIEQSGNADREYQRQGGFPVLKSVTDWKTGETIEREVLLLDPTFLSLSHIWGRVLQFKASGVIGDSVFLAISAIAIVLLVIGLTAVISAIFLTRSITRAVHHLYVGTMRIEAGDFDQEIPIFGHDQLGGLTVSFNRMTRSIRELLFVSAQKQRLDQEMKIAAEVQTRLFPRSLPKTNALDFAPGICIPARAVSGDYYDFIEAAGRIAITVADVCGKGVSAALMMANLQANLRGQVQACYDVDEFRLALGAPTGNPAPSAEHMIFSKPVQRIVERVNQQLASAMIDASYITFFYAEFDEQTRGLRYTNAGHNPPLLYRKNGGQIERLDRGGTVLGLFRDSTYEEVQLQLHSGDVLVAFTDGLVEARSKKDGEEFGEDRVVRALLESVHLPAGRIEQHLLEQVRRWTADAEQEDDLTLVIFKVL